VMTKSYGLQTTTTAYTTPQHYTRKEKQTFDTISLPHSTVNSTIPESPDSPPPVTCTKLDILLQLCASTSSAILHLPQPEQQTIPVIFAYCAPAPFNHQASKHSHVPMHHRLNQGTQQAQQDWIRHFPNHSTATTTAPWHGC